MSNFLRSVLYSTSVLVIGLVAMFAIYNNVTKGLSGSSLAKISPASGNEKDVNFEDSSVTGKTSLNSGDIITHESYHHIVQKAAYQLNSSINTFDIIENREGKEKGSFHCIYRRFRLADGSNYAVTNDSSNDTSSWGTDNISSAIGKIGNIEENNQSSVSADEQSSFDFYTNFIDNAAAVDISESGQGILTSFDDQEDMSTQASDITEELNNSGLVEYNTLSEFTDALDPESQDLLAVFQAENLNIPFGDDEYDQDSLDQMNAMVDLSTGVTEIVFSGNTDDYLGELYVSYACVKEDEYGGSYTSTCYRYSTFDEDLESSNDLLKDGGEYTINGNSNSSIYASLEDSIAISTMSAETKVMKDQWYIDTNDDPGAGEYELLYPKEYAYEKWGGVYYLPNDFLGQIIDSVNLWRENAFNGVSSSVRTAVKNKVADALKYNQ